MSSHSSVERLQAWHLAQVEKGQSDLSKFRGNGDWTQLSPAEEDVFQLALDDMPALTAAWWAWECVAGIVDASLGDASLIDDLRCEVPFLAGARHSILSLPVDHPDVRAAWSRFAALLGIGTRTAHAFFAKRYLWDVRRGLISYPD